MILCLVIRGPLTVAGLCTVAVAIPMPKLETDVMADPSRFAMPKVERFGNHQ